jgi:hypothetical protein
MPDKQQRTRRQFTPEFKRDAVELVRTAAGRSPRSPAIWASTTPRSATGSSRTASTVASARDFPATSAPGCASWSATTPGCGWSVIYSNEPSPSGARRRRRRDALPLCRRPEGRRVSGSGRLPGGRGDPLGLLRLDDPASPGTLRAPAGGGKVGRGDPPHPRPLQGHLRRPAGACRAQAARLEGEPQAHRAPDAHPRHRRLPAPPAPQPDPPRHHRRARTSTCWAGCSTLTGQTWPGAAT